ncbi:MAG: hypothetical protein HYZ45_02075 [Burkholderiales bacterium]|nr:hypothetical protein [Burkholderiales bacterium]
MKQTVAIVLSVLLALAVALGIWKSKNTPTDSKSNSLLSLTSPPAKKVRLLTGSAKFSYLQDPEMQALLRKNGIELELIKSGSFEQDKGQAVDLDAVWPAGANQANDWQALMPGSTSHPVMSTALALASWKALLPVFEKNGLGKVSANAHGDFYLDKALPMMLAGKRWSDLQDNTVFAVNKSFLINTPDLRKSNTSALYIAALAYIHNKNEVPQQKDAAEQMAKLLAPLITRQGFQEGTLAGPFEDYLGQGMGKAPLVLIYESQFLEARSQKKLNDQHFLLYPQPGLLLKHVLIAKTESGKKLGTLLATDPDAQKIAARFGFRTNDPAIFSAHAKELGLDAPPLLNLAETPSTAILDSMVQTIVNIMESK